MGRSAAAVARRAERRGRSVKEQAKLDAAAAAAAAFVKHGGKRKAPATHADRAAAAKKRAVDAGHIVEADDWTCKSCGNLNWAKREVCNSNTCSERRPSRAGGGGSAAAPNTCRPAAAAAAGIPGGGKGKGKGKGKGRGRGKKPKAAWTDPAVARAWAPQAGADQVARNQELRAQYQADPSAMTEADRARAKVLLERDERKRAKKAARAARNLERKAAAERNRERKAAKARREGGQVQSPSS